MKVNLKREFEAIHCKAAFRISFPRQTAEETSAELTIDVRPNAWLIFDNGMPIHTVTETEFRERFNVNS